MIDPQFDARLRSTYMKSRCRSTSIDKYIYHIKQIGIPYTDLKIEEKEKRREGF
jgi:hypothetical protein